MRIRTNRILIFLLGVVSIVVIMRFIKAHNITTMPLIWTCTTFFDFDKKDRWQAFQSAINSIIAIHSQEELNHISTWLVINEYAENPREDWAKLMHTNYPFIEFIQKTKEQHGQAKGLNMILERIVPYKYWFHWEETWNTQSAFIHRAVTTMEDNSDISQLQMTVDHGRPDWLDVESERITCIGDVCRIKPHHVTPSFINKNPDNIDLNALSKYWPLYSLRPSINRVSFYTSRGVGMFPEDPKLWPYLFEMHYSIRWLRAGAVKAVYKNAPIVRQTNHVSTY